MVSNSRSLSKIEAVLARCSRDIRNLNRPQEFEILPGAPQIKQMTSKMVFEVIRLQLYTMPYFWKDEYEGGYPVKKRNSGHQRRQQGCPVIEREIMAVKDNSRNHNDQEKNDSRRKQHTQRNQEKHNKRERSCSSTKEKGWPNLGRRRSGLYRRKGLYTK